MNDIASDFVPVLGESSPAEYIARDILKRNIDLIAVTGPSGSGKTTFAKTLSRALSPHTCLVLKVDSYWQYTRPEMARRSLTGYDWETRDVKRFKRDLRTLRAKESIQKPIFDYRNERPSGRTVAVESADTIILEDTLDFTNIAELNIFIYAPEEVLIARRLKRDAYKTGFSGPGELLTYLRAKSLPAYREKLLPVMLKSNYVVDTCNNKLHRNTKLDNVNVI